jgi:hypothetical protein
VFGTSFDLTKRFCLEVLPPDAHDSRTIVAPCNTAIIGDKTAEEAEAAAEEEMATGRGESKG